MPRIYFSNESYPELREIESRWERHKTWYRAFGSAFRDWRFWRFWAIQLVILGGWFALDRLASRITDLPFVWEGFMHAVFLAGAVLLNALLTVTWGGDLMRPHLRRVSPSAREACPECGHLLTGHLTEKGKMILCPECGGQIDSLVFDPPYRIPKKYLATGGIFSSITPGVPGNVPDHATKTDRN